VYTAGDRCTLRGIGVHCGGIGVHCYFLSISQNAVSADINKNLAVAIFET
jgi:hypothetical protein